MQTAVFNQERLYKQCILVIANQREHEQNIITLAEMILPTAFSETGVIRDFNNLLRMQLFRKNLFSFRLN